MATPYKMHISPEDTGLLKVEQTAETAGKAGDLLQEDLEKHHVFFNTDGFHNHIPHHILALYGTGAPASALQRGYDINTSYQRAVLPTHEDVVGDLISTWEHAERYLGKEKYYPDFLRFFQREISAHGWQSTLTKYLFKGDAAADDMLVRLFSGFLHPLIQLMYGMEWVQPAIVAEALAQTAVHGNDIGPYLKESEALANESGGDNAYNIAELLEAVRNNKKLAHAAKMEDSNKVRDGVMVRARDEMLDIASKVRVKPEKLEEKTAEMFEACVLMAAAAAVHPTKFPKFDFFLIHHVNASPIFVTINAQPWIPLPVKVRLLEWKIRMDLIQYAARAVPSISLEKITRYQPKDTKGTTPLDIISRLHGFPDDGHAIKLGRASLICYEQTRKYQHNDWVRIKGDDLWIKLYHLIVDSVEAPGPHWVRTCGLEEAWKDVPDASDAKL